MATWAAPAVKSTSTISTLLSSNKYVDVLTYHDIAVKTNSNVTSLLGGSFATLVWGSSGGQLQEVFPDRSQVKSGVRYGWCGSIAGTKQVGGSTASWG